MLDYNQLAKEVFEVQNKLRKDPTYLVPILEKRLTQFKGTYLSIPGRITLITNEGANAVKECIAYLKKAKPLGELSWSDSMAHAALDHATDTGKNGVTGHNGTDGSTVDKRLDRYGQWQSTMGENCDYGNDLAEEIIMSLIVDDGVPSRGHRTNIFNPDFKTVGVGCAPHTGYGHCTVLDYAGGFKANGKDGKSKPQKVELKKEKELDQKEYGNDMGGGFKDFEKQFEEMKLKSHNMMGSNQTIPIKPTKSNNQPDIPEGVVNWSTKTSTLISNGKKTTTTLTNYTYQDGRTETKTQTITESA